VPAGSRMVEGLFTNEVLNQGLVPAAQVMFTFCAGNPRASITAPSGGYPGGERILKIVKQRSLFRTLATLASMKAEDWAVVVQPVCVVHTALFWATAPTGIEEIVKTAAAQESECLNFCIPLSVTIVLPAVTVHYNKSSFCFAP
jgi:hypothetical protein